MVGIAASGLPRIVKLLAVLGAVISLSSTATEAQVLYAADGAGGNSTTNLYIVNPATGAVVSTIGPIGFPVTGLAFHPATGVLYGTTGGEVGTPSLVSIDTLTGAGTLIGANGQGPVADISFRADGTLFGWSEGSDDLVTISLATGVATVVSDSGLGTSGSGIAFSPSGTLFFAGSGSNGMLRTIDPATGAPTDVAVMTGGPAPNRVNAMAFNSAGVLFGSVRGGTLVTINTTTAAVTTVGSTGLSSLDALAFGPAAQALVIPTMSQWSVIVLGLLIAGSLVFLRRRA